MRNYLEATMALHTAMNLMIEEGDDVLVAAICHPLHMAESQLMLKRADMLTVMIQESANARRAGPVNQT